MYVLLVGLFFKMRLNFTLINTLVSFKKGINNITRKLNIINALTSVHGLICLKTLSAWDMIFLQDYCPSKNKKDKSFVNLTDNSQKKYKCWGWKSEK